MTEARRVGLIAGWGDYPIIVAKALKRQQIQVYCVAIKDHADPILRDHCDHVMESGLARLGSHIRYFKSHHVDVATMAGKIHKSRLFKRFFLLTHIPDICCLRTFYPHFVSASRDRKDDTLLTAVVDTYRKHGITLAPATDYAPELLVESGQVAGRRLSSVQWRDVQFGWHLAKGMGGLDVGQSVAVKGRAVLAVEAVEGTDACIERAGKLCEAGGFTIVKVAKPQQDMRFDVPTIGIGTLRSMHKAGARILAIEADKTILIDKPAVINFAKKHHISIVAVDEKRVVSRLAA